MSVSDVTYGRCHPMKEVHYKEAHVLPAGASRSSMTPVAQVKPMQMAERGTQAVAAITSQTPRKRLVVRSLLTGNLVKFPVPSGGQFGSMPSIVPIPRPAAGATSGQQLFQVVAQSAKKTFLIPYPQQPGDLCTTSPLTTTVVSPTLSTSTVINSAPRIQSKTSRGTPVQAVSPTPTPTPDSNNPVRRFIIFNRPKDTPTSKRTAVGSPDVGPQSTRSVMTMVQIPQSDSTGAVPDSTLVVTTESCKNASSKVARYSTLPANIPTKDPMVPTSHAVIVVPKSAYGIRPTSEPIRNIFTTSSEVTNILGGSQSHKKQDVASVPVQIDKPELTIDNVQEEKNCQFGEDSELSIKIDSVFSLSGESSDMAAAAPPLSPEDTGECSDTDTASIDGDAPKDSSDIDENIRSAQKAVQQLQLTRDTSGVKDGSESDTSEESFSICGDRLTSADFEHLPSCLPNLPQGIELRFREARSQHKAKTPGPKHSTSPVRADDEGDVLDRLFNVISKDVTIPDAVPCPGPVKKKHFCKRTARKSCTGQRIKHQTARKSCTGFKFEKPASEEDVAHDGKICSLNIRSSTLPYICPCGGRCPENECRKVSSPTQSTRKPHTGNSVRDKHSTVLKLLIGEQPANVKREENSATQWTPTIFDVSGTSILAKPPGFWINVQPRITVKETVPPGLVRQERNDADVSDTVEDDSPPLELKISDVVSLRGKDESISDTREMVIFPKRKRRRKRKPKQKPKKKEKMYDTSEKRIFKPKVKKSVPQREPAESPGSDDSDDIPLIAFKNTSGKKWEKSIKSELNCEQTEEDIKKEKIPVLSKLSVESTADTSSVSALAQQEKEKAKRGRKSKQKQAALCDPEPQVVNDPVHSFLKPPSRKRGKPLKSKNSKGILLAGSSPETPLNDEPQGDSNSSKAAKMDIKREQEDTAAPTKHFVSSDVHVRHRASEIASLLFLPPSEYNANKSDVLSCTSVVTPVVDTPTLSELTSNDNVNLEIPSKQNELVSHWPRRRGRFCKRRNQDKSSRTERAQLLSSSAVNSEKDGPKGCKQSLEQGALDGPSVQSAGDIELGTSLEADPPVNKEVCNAVGSEVRLSTETTQTVAEVSPVLGPTDAQDTTVAGSAPFRMSLGSSATLVVECVDRTVDHKAGPSGSPLDRIQRLKEQLRQQEEALAALRREREETRSVLQALDM